MSVMACHGDPQLNLRPNRRLLSRARPDAEPEVGCLRLKNPWGSLYNHRNEIAGQAQTGQAWRWPDLRLPNFSAEQRHRQRQKSDLSRATIIVGRPHTVHQRLRRAENTAAPCGAPAKHT